MADVKLQAVISAKDEASAKLNKVAGTIAKFGIAAAAAGAAAAGIFVKKSIDAAKAEEVAMAKVNAILGTLKGSLQSNTEATERAARAAMRLGFDDEDAAMAMAKLLQVTKDQNLAQKALTLSMDLARFKGIELGDAQTAVTLAMMGNTRVLKQLGIDVPENASKQDILRLALEKVGGQAEAYGNTFAGAQDKVRVATENVQEEIGKIFLPMVTGMFNKINEFLTSDRLAGWLVTIKKYFADLKVQLDIIIPVIKDSFGESIAVVNQLLSEMNIQLGMGQVNMVDLALALPVGAMLTFSKAMQYAAGFMFSLFRLAEGLSVAVEKLYGWLKKVAELYSKSVAPVVAGLTPMLQAGPNFLAGLAQQGIGAWQELISGSGNTGSRAGGGYVSGGSSYMVGERGPELFTPGSSGNITPNNKLGEGVTLNISGNTFGNRNDIDYMINEIKRSLNRDQVLAQLRV